MSITNKVRHKLIKSGTKQKRLPQGRSAKHNDFRNALQAPIECAVKSGRTNREDSMGWKVEQWMKDVFPGEDKIYSEYRSLPRRELVVVAAAVLDSALVELLSKRLAGPESEIHGFLGINGDGRAPCGSFGARIQLALLTSVISENDAVTLRTIKNIRNKFAHEVLSDFNSPSVLPLVTKLHDQFLLQSNLLIDAGHLPGPRRSMDFIRPHLSTVPEAGAGLFLAIFCTYQAYFHRLFEKVHAVEAMSTPPCT